MKDQTPDPLVSGLLQEMASAMGHTSGTEDDDDDRDDEHPGENEASVRELDENTEAPEEFSVDDQDELTHPEDDRDREDE